MLLALVLAFGSPHAAAAAADPSAPAQLVISNIRSTTLDLWRPYPDSDKVLVPVTLPGGAQELFVVDTGAATSVITKEAADRLGLDPAESSGYLQGLSGTVEWSRTRVPKMQLGGFTLQAVDVAVGVAGVPDQIGPLPIAGILGNNVWSNFVCVLDYPADRMELYLPDAWKPRGKTSPMAYRDGAVLTPVRLTAEAADGTRARGEMALEVDTGAADLLLMGAVGEPLRAVTTTGEEPIFGVGADLDKIPDRQILQVTRRAHITEVEAGGRTMTVKVPAAWLCADGGCGEGGLRMPGLLGYSVFGHERVTFDFPGSRFQIAQTRGPERQFDALGAWLTQEAATHGEDPHRAQLRAGVLWAKGDKAGAGAAIRKALEALPGDPALTCAKARLQRLEGDYAGANVTLEQLPPAQLVEEGEWVSYIDGLVLDGRGADALRIAREALAGAGTDDKEDYLVALSDALLASGDTQAASAAIDEANRASLRGDSAHLLRKARIATAAGDRYGAMVALRSLIEVIPLRGQPIWWYGLLVQGADLDTFRADLTKAMGRLHAEDQPYDFVGAAWAAVGDMDRARVALAAGQARDCTPLTVGPERDNCDAWYLALDRHDLPGATAAIGRALAADPSNSSYLDTAAVVALANGDLPSALGAARQAARLQPDDPYLLWQLSRIEALAPPSGVTP